MKIENIGLDNFANIKRWKQIEKSGSGTQVLLRFGHVNPENNIDPLYGQGNKILKQEQKGNVIETTSTIGISTKRGKISDVYDFMIQYADMGLLKGFTVEDMRQLKDQTNKSLPLDLDFWTDISIADYKEESIASQSLENIVDQFTKGFANVSIPGASSNMTLEDVFRNPMVIEQARKQGLDETKMKEAIEKIKEVSKQAIAQVEESNIKYEIGSFKDYKAVYYILPKLTKDEKITKKDESKIKLKNPDGSYRSVSLGGDITNKFALPKDAFKREKYPIGGKMLQAIKVNNYIISGNFLNSLSFMPSGKSFCQSLTKFKKVTQTTHHGNITFIDYFMVPVNSNLSYEGYLNREESENMVLKLKEVLESDIQ